MTPRQLLHNQIRDGKVDISEIDDVADVIVFDPTFCPDLEVKLAVEAELRRRDVARVVKYRDRVKHDFYGDKK